MNFRIAALVSLALLATACSSTNEDDDTTPDAGQVDDAGVDAGQSGDAGDEAPVDAGPEPCDADPNVPEECEGVGGGCTPGIRFCDDGFWSACEGRQQPIARLCDVPSCAGGFNDGCECLVGTTQPCYTGPEGTRSVGACRDGVQTCVATEDGSAWGDCENQILPQPEDCSVRNLDCDNDTPADGECTCTDGAQRPCGGVEGGDCVLGTQTCSGGVWGDCVGAVQPGGACEEESCLGGPNPGCECVVGAEEPCYTGPAGTEGVGTCAAGTRTCLEGGKWDTCLGQVQPPSNCDTENCTGTPHAACL